MTRTCPRYYAQSAFVASVSEYISDFEKGRLGDTRQLPAALREYLQALECERSDWDNEQQFRAIEQAKK